MKLTRDMAVFDVESTGVDPVKDRIVSFGVCVLHPDLSRSQWHALINPGIPISAEATAKHGYTDEDVKDCPPFSHFATKIWKGLQNKDLGGFNIIRFDACLLDEEMRRCGLYLDLRETHVVDCFAIFSKKNPRTLADAVRLYCGRDQENGHHADVDASDTADVLLGQLAMYPDLDEMELAELAAFSSVDDLNYVDLARKLYRDADGFCCYAFGKNKGVRVADEKSYAKWMFGASFPGSTLDALEDELARLKGLGK